MDLTGKQIVAHLHHSFNQERSTAAAVATFEKFSRIRVLHIVQQVIALREAGQAEEASALLQQHIEQEPNDMAARECLGDIYYAQEAYQKARRCRSHRVVISGTSAFTLPIIDW